MHRNQPESFSAQSPPKLQGIQPAIDCRQQWANSFRWKLEGDIWLNRTEAAFISDS